METIGVFEGRIRNLSPTDLRSLPSVLVTSENEILTTVATAKKAQTGWEKSGFENRAKRMKLAGKAMLLRRQEVLELIYEELGKPPAEMLMSEVVGPLQYISDWIRVARPELKPRPLPISPLAFPRKKGVIELLPRGVVGVIAPWNFPLANYFKPVFAALLCGNSVVIKPSEYSPRTAEWFVKIMGEFLPDGVLSLVQGDRDVGQALVRSGIDALTFTGSYSSGSSVLKLAAERMIPCSVELGGKDAAIVLADCDLDRTVAGIMNWALHNAGQACGDIERVYLQDSIAEPFLAKLVKAVSGLRVGMPEVSTLSSRGSESEIDVGPPANSVQLDLIQDHIKDALSRGAKLLCGGHRTGKGLSLLPTVLDFCDHTMKIMKEPTFGPVIPIARVRTPDEAVALVNDCEYGLNASVWSQNFKLVEEIGRQLQVGTVYVNNHAFTGAMPAAPWTGVKKTGYGIANSTFALQHYTRPRTFVVDRKKSVDGWWYPMNKMAEELGQCLAEAQLGNVIAAIKIPGLMAKRQRTVLRYAQTGEHEPRTGDSPEISDTVRGDEIESLRQSGPNLGLKQSIRRFVGRQIYRLKVSVSRAAGKLYLPLTSLEVNWGQAAMNAVYSTEGVNGAPGGVVDGALSGGLGETLSRGHGGPPKSLEPPSRNTSRLFLEDFHRSLPFPADLVMRGSLWLVGISPLFKLKKLKLFHQISAREQLDIVISMDTSNSYLMRQIAILLKMNGALSYVSTSRFKTVIAASGKAISANATQPRLSNRERVAPSQEIHL